MEIFAYLITKLYLLCSEGCFSELPFLSINCLIENHFRVAERQKCLLHASEAYFKNLWKCLFFFFRERVATLGYGEDETFPTNMSSARLSLQSIFKVTGVGRMCPSCCTLLLNKACNIPVNHSRPLAKITYINVLRMRRGRNTLFQGEYYHKESKCSLKTNIYPF